MKRFLFAAMALTAVGMAQAQQAADDAGDAVYTVGQEYIQVGTTPGDQTGAVNGLNGGFGFNRWQRGGYGSSTNAGSTRITNVAASFGMGTQQFGLRSAPDGSEGADARRRMNNDLPVGGTFFFSMMAGGNGAGQANTQGFFGVEIRGASLSNPGRDMFSIDGETGQNWSVDGLTTSLAVTGGQRLDVLITSLGGDSFRVDLNALGGGSDSKIASSASAGVLLRTAQFYVFNTNGDFYVNNLRAVPEPATMIALGGGLLMVLRRRKKS